MTTRYLDKTEMTRLKEGVGMMILMEAVVMMKFAVETVMTSLTEGLDQI